MEVVGFSRARLDCFSLPASHCLGRLRGLRELAWVAVGLVPGGGGPFFTLRFIAWWCALADSAVPESGPRARALGSHLTSAAWSTVSSNNAKKKFKKQQKKRFKNRAAFLSTAHQKKKRNGRAHRGGFSIHAIARNFSPRQAGQRCSLLFGQAADEMPRCALLLGQASG